MPGTSVERTTWLPPPLVGSLGRRVAAVRHVRPGQVAGLADAAVGAALGVDRRRVAARVRRDQRVAGRVGRVERLVRRDVGGPVGLGARPAVVLRAVVAQQQHALAGAAGHVLGRVLAERVPVVVPVVADRLVRRDVLDQRRADVEQVVEVAGARAACSGSPRRRRARGRRSRSRGRACGTRSSTGVPTRSARVVGGSDTRISSATGPSRRMSSSVSARNGRWIGNERMPCSSVGRAALDRLAQPLGVERQRLERVGHVDEQLRVRVGDRRDLAGEVGGSGARTRARPVLGSLTASAITGSRWVRNGTRSSIAWLIDYAAAGERVAVALEHALLVAAELGVEQAEVLVELDRLDRVLERDRRARRRTSPATRPGVMSMYFRPSAERGRTLIVGVDRQRLDRLVELHVDDRDRARGAALADGRA